MRQDLTFMNIAVHSSQHQHLSTEWYPWWDSRVRKCVGAKTIITSICSFVCLGVSTGFDPIDSLTHGLVVLVPPRKYFHWVIL